MTRQLKPKRRKAIKREMETENQVMERLSDRARKKRISERERRIKESAKANEKKKRRRESKKEEVQENKSTPQTTKAKKALHLSLHPSKTRKMTRLLLLQAPILHLMSQPLMFRRSTSELNNKTNSFTYFKLKVSKVLPF